MSLPTNFFIGRGGVELKPFVFNSISMGGLEFTHSNGTHHDNTSVKDIRFSTDGTKCFLFSYQSNTDSYISQLNLSTAFDLRNPTSRTYWNTFSNDPAFGTAWNFSSDGMHLIAGERNTIYHYVLSNPYDLTGVNKNAPTSTISSGGGTQGGGYSTDGSLFWTYGRSGGDMRVWDLPTPYHFTGATLNSGYTQYSTQIGSEGTGGDNIYGVHMSGDGSCIAAVDSFLFNRIYFTQLSTPYDFGTLNGRTYSEYSRPLGGTPEQMGLAITPNFVYICDGYGEGEVRQYNATVS